jgi:DNA polymerase-3 subunit gamma/tau
VSKALYRKYRSRSLDEVVGQSHVTDLLKNAFKKGKVSHAYLLTGPRGTGKTSVARIIAHAVNELEYSDTQHLDIIEIDAASNRRIDDIRDLREKVHIAPVNAKFKVYIIDEVHMLTSESFNALLKTLEEPPEHVIFILATTELHKVPATIVSRTQRFHFRPATSADAIKHLRKIANKEKIAIDDDALELIARHANGSFRDSMSLLDQLSSLSEHVTSALVESVLGMAPRESVEKLLSAIVEKKADTIIELIDNLATQGISGVTLTDQLMQGLAYAARTHHDLYRLIDQLMTIAKAHDPYLKLVATLVSFVKPTQTSQRTVATRVGTEAPVIAAKPNRAPIASKPVVEQKTPTVSEVQKIEPLTVEPQEFDWDKVLIIMKSRHAPLYAVLSRANQAFDGTTLRLGFTYAIHRKKIEKPQYQKQLIGLISDVLGLTVEIAIYDANTATTEISDAAKSITAIMGGGEPVNATI